MATVALKVGPEISYPEVMENENLSEHLQSLENFLFDPAARRDTAAVSNLLADDFREFGSSGRSYDRLDILAELSTEEPVVISLTDFACSLVSPTVALVTYRSLSVHGSRPPTQALRSSLWVLRPGDPRTVKSTGRESRWQMLFHQGTRF